MEQNSSIKQKSFAITTTYISYT